MASLALAAHSDPLQLRATLESDPDLFDSIWYAAFPPEQSGGSDIDRILHGK